MTDRQLTRAEHGKRCPAPYRDSVGTHNWIETTMPSAAEQRFSCDFCPAIAVEQRAQKPAP